MQPSAREREREHFAPRREEREGRREDRNPDGDWRAGGGSGREGGRLSGRLDLEARPSFHPYTRPRRDDYGVIYNRDGRMRMDDVQAEDRMRGGGSRGGGGGSWRGGGGRGGGRPPPRERLTVQDLDKKMDSYWDDEGDAKKEETEGKAKKEATETQDEPAKD